MGQIKGRSDDMLIIRGVNLFHTQIEELILGMDNLIPHYQVVVTREGTMDDVELRVEVSEDLMQKMRIETIDQNLVSQSDFLSNLQGTLRQKIKNNIGLSMAVHLKAFGAIPRSQGGKLSRILDLRK